jgi:hypothetical protein
VPDWLAYWLVGWPVLLCVHDIDKNLKRKKQTTSTKVIDGVDFVFLLSD